ncbi:DUF4342 domain-containing protein [Chloroflexota bacterium]
MSEEAKIVEEEQVDEQSEAQAEPAQSHQTVTEEIKVQAQDLFKVINDIIREGTAKRITIMRNDRILVDIPLAIGVAASLIFAVYMPILSAIVAVGALVGGCTVRIEREEPEEEA